MCRRYITHVENEDEFNFILKQIYMNTFNSQIVKHTNMGIFEITETIEDGFKMIYICFYLYKWILKQIDSGIIKSKETPIHTHLPIFFQF
jgi:hypothetical protein